MSTGPKHFRILGTDANGDEECVSCRCAIGADHDAGGEVDTGETLSASDAALIWGGSGMDEDYTFGYDESELRS